jgi:hypothetical protein
MHEAPIHGTNRLSTSDFFATCVYRQTNKKQYMGNDVICSEGPVVGAVLSKMVMEGLLEQAREELAGHFRQKAQPGHRP